MHINQVKKLNGYHVVFLVQSSLVGVGLLSMPYLISPMGFSQWWLPLVFGIVANITLIPMIWLLKQYKNHNIYTINEKLLGKWLGRFVNLLLVLYATAFGASLIERYLDLVQVSALPDKTIIGSLIFFLFLLTYIIHGGIKSIARFCIMTFFLTLPMMYFLQWGYVDGEISHMLPFYTFTSEEFVKAFKDGYVTMIGYELILVYYPYVIHQQKAFKHVSIGIWISCIIYFLVTFVAVMFFSEWQLANILYPILKLLKSVEMSFIDRVDVMGISLWVFLVLSTTSVYIWAGKKGLDSLRSNNKTYHLYILAIILFIVVAIPFSDSFEKIWHSSINYVGYGIILWPNLLIIIHLIKFRKRESVK
ncbi:GerAB/ArcD/ProY family transporter [Jeotgalibacillus marinus]|uniref:GerAB/ArcD/ProY family transporter n=1 Tax=Jeotgalibacillus marinus TaxID=86667 RepID=A0ABV3Q2K3_9BACL